MAREISPTFCVLPFIQLATRPDGTLNPCCLSSEHLLKGQDGRPLRVDRDSLAEIWSSPELQEIRRAMLDGRPVASCDVCYRDEAAGRFSLRERFNRDWFARLGESELRRRINLHSSPVYLDLRFGAKCNLMCRMCFPINSNRLAEEFQKLMDRHADFPQDYRGMLAQPDAPLSWGESAQFQDTLERLLPEVRDIYLAGGEPMMMEGTLKLLRRLVEAGVASRIRLNLHSNMTLWNPQVADLFQHFQAVILNCSIDGVGQVDEYIRFPTSFKRVEETFDRYLQLGLSCPVLSMSLATTVSLYNVTKLDELVEWFVAKKMLYPKVLSDIQLSTMYYPEILGSAMIPVRHRHKVHATLNRVRAILAAAGFWDERYANDLSGIARHVEQAPAPSARQRESLRAFQLHLDRERGTYLSEMIPDVGEIFAEPAPFTQEMHA